MAKFTPEAREHIIEQRLRSAFSPTQLYITDESDLHAGHRGNLTGASHFYIQIASLVLAGQSRLAQHRMIYHALQDLIPHDIHALRIRCI